MSRNIPEIMEKISCFLCKKQDKLFVKIGLVCDSENRPHSTKHKSSLPVIEEASDSKDDNKERYDERPDVGDT